MALRGHLETDFATHVADLTLSNRHFVAKSRRFRRHQLVAKAAFGVFATNGGRRGSDFVAWAAACVPPALRRQTLRRPRCRGHAAPPGGGEIPAAAVLLLLPCAAAIRCAGTTTLCVVAT